MPAKTKRHRPLGFIHALITTLNAIAALLFIAAACSDRIAPDRTLFFAYIGLLFPVFLLINLLFLGYWTIARRWKHVVAIVVILLINYRPISQYVPIHLPSAVDETTRREQIKLLSYNVMGFAYKNHTTGQPNRILQYIIDANADIVCLQEVMVSSSNDFITLHKVRKALNRYRYYSYMPLVHYKKYSIGLALFSKYPILKSWRIPYQSGFNGSSAHLLKINGQRIAVINNHLESFKLTSEDRSRYADFLTSMDIDKLGGLRHKLGAAYRIRAEQARTVAREIEQLQTSTDGIIVCGDFNDTPVSYVHRVIQGPLTDAYAASGLGFGITYHQNFFWFRIDHLMHSDNITSSHATVDRIRHSDHYPIWCYLKVDTTDTRK